MAALLSSDLESRLQGAPTQQIARQLGVSPSQASSAISAAVPLLLGALGHNASQPQGAQALFGALQNDHTGMDLGSVLGSVLGGGGQGGQILGHVFGDHQPRAAQAVGQATGIGQDKAHVLLRWLAPIAMAYLAKRVFDQRHAGASAGTPTASSPTPTQSTAPSGATQTPPSPGKLGDVLAPEVEHAQHGGLLGAVLGGGGLDELLKAGSSIFGGATTRDSGASTRPSA
jgi:hypothetical protein